MSFVVQPSFQSRLLSSLLPVGKRWFVVGMLWSVVAIGVLAGLVFAKMLLGVAMIVASVAVEVTLFAFFLDYGIEQPKLPYSLHDAILRARREETVNLEPFLGREPREIFFSYGANTSADILAKTLSHARARLAFARLGIDSREAIVMLTQAKGDPLDVALMRMAVHAAHSRHRRIRFSDLLSAFARSVPEFRQFLFDRAFEEKDFDAVAHWEDRLIHFRERRNAFWRKENLLAVPPFGRAWAFGYTPLLDQFTQDIGYQMQRSQDVPLALGHHAEIEALERVLVKAANSNALLIAEPGVGSEDVLASFVYRVVTGGSQKQLNYRRVLSLNLAAVVSGYKSVGEAEGRAGQVLFDAARAGGTILLIENIHAVLGAGGVDLTSILLPFLEGSRLQIVATTTHQALHEVVEKRGALTPLFDHVEVHEPSQAQALQMLLDATPSFERRYRMFLPYATLKAVVQYADRTIQDVPFPRKAFDVLEDALITAAGEKAKVLREGHVAKTISQHTKVPVGALTKEEGKKLLNLEAFIHERIVDQEDAVRVISDALRRARAGLTQGMTTRPIGTFLFLGPTGVGKTETAKALAEAYFDDEDRMVRLDMSEFQGVDGIDRLIGSPATHEEGRMTNAIRENPFTLLLLDEFEKANPKVLDLFLQVFDEGRMKDGWGRKVSFTNALIIATSNAGAEFIREYMAAGSPPGRLHDALREEILRKQIFRPELVNRFDAVVVFQPLELEQVRQIAKLMLKKFAQHVEKERGVFVTIDDDALNAIIASGFNQEFGARELRRILQDSVENVVARRILQDAKRGDTITVSRADLFS